MVDLRSFRGIYVCFDSGGLGVIAFGDDEEEAREIYGYVAELLQERVGDVGAEPSCYYVSFAVDVAEPVNQYEALKTILKAYATLLTYYANYSPPEKDKITAYGIIPTTIAQIMKRYGIYPQNAIF